MTDMDKSPRTLKILVDTNVWIDYFLADRPGHDDATSFINAAWAESTQLLYPIGALQDVFAILIMELKRGARKVQEVDESCMHALRRIAWGCIDALREVATAVGADESDAWFACKYRKLNWDLEDNMVLAAAKRAEADYLVTSDRGLISKSNIAALLPADMTTLLEEMGGRTLA